MVPTIVADVQIPEMLFLGVVPWHPGSATSARFCGRYSPVGFAHYSFSSVDFARFAGSSVTVGAFRAELTAQPILGACH
jgi:hypothetical protein